MKRKGGGGHQNHPQTTGKPLKSDYNPTATKQTPPIEKTFEKVGEPIFHR